MQFNTIQADTSAMLTCGTRDGVHQRGFARAVATQQGQGFTLRQRQVHIVQDDGFTITSAQRFNA
jgi:hypothetical protein